MVRKSLVGRVRNGPASAARGVVCLTLLILASAIPARAQEDCFDEAFCLEGIRNADGLVGIRIKNLLPGAMTMRLNMQLENMATTEPLPVVLTIPGGQTVQPLRLEVQNEYARWGYRFDAKWIMGTLHARHQRNALYWLPFDQDGSWLVGQGYDGRTTHRNKFALDFDMPEGTPIHAARAGVVIETEDSFRVGGPDEALKTRANFVKVQHEDGTIGNYVHLRNRGVRVRVGQRVRAGDLLGLSGNTGFTTGPHLHFEVYAISGELERSTIPVQFDTNEGVRELEEGTRYRHPQDRQRTVPSTSRRGRGWD